MLSPQNSTWLCIEGLWFHRLDRWHDEVHHRHRASVQASRPVSEYQLRTKSIGSQSEESAARQGAPTPKVSARQFTPAAALVIYLRGQFIGVWPKLTFSYTPAHTNKTGLYSYRSPLELK